MLDARKIFVVGISFILGLSVDMLPGVYQNVHPWLKPIFESSLSLAMISAIILNLILRMGVAKRQTIELHAETAANQKLIDFMDLNGRNWGALQEVIQKTKNALAEFNEALILAGLRNIPVRYEAVYDEFNIDVDIAYEGEPFAAGKDRPDDWLEASDNDFISFAMNVVYHHADKVTVHRKDGFTHYRLHFIH